MPATRLLLIGLLSLCSTTQASDVTSITDRLIVQYKDAANRGHLPISLSRLSLRQQVQPLAVLRQTREGSYVVRLPQAVALAEAERLAAQPVEANSDIAYAEPDRILRPMVEHSNVTAQSVRPNFRDWDAMVHLTQAWTITQGSPNVHIGVVDSGITAHHLLSRTMPGYDFVAQIGEIGAQDQGRDGDAADLGDYVTASDLAAGNGLTSLEGCEVARSSWHGTAVAGLIGGDRDNVLGVSGVMQQGTVTPLRATWRCSGNLRDIVDALLWAAGVTVPGVPSNPTPVQVINVSLGYAGACSQFETSAYKQIDDKGVTVLVAAGNDGGDSMNSAPANCPRVIAVAASDTLGNLAAYSNRGANVAIMAPGGVAGAPLPLISDLGVNGPLGDTVTYGQGTSFSVAWASGTAGLMLAVNPTLKRDGIWQMLLYSGKPNTSCSGTCGGGVLDIARAVKLAKDGLYYAEAVFDFGAGYKVNEQPRQVAPFTNLSGAPISIHSIALAGVDANHFTQLSDTCSGQTIADRQACEVTVKLTATTAGLKDAELILRTDTPSGKVRAKISADVQVASATGTGSTIPPESAGGGGGCTMAHANNAADISFIFLLMFLVRLRRRGQ